MKKKISSLLFVLFFIIAVNPTSAQFFYKDIWNATQLNKEMLLLKTEKIKNITVRSFENDGEPSEGFFCEKKINRNYTLAETVTRSMVTSQSLLSTWFNAKGKIVRTSDSTISSLNITEYEYDENERIVNVTTTSKANDDANSIIESHQYFYSAAGQPEKMIRKKNDTEVSTVIFKTDEKGNVTEENEVSQNGMGKKYFYYYDNKNNLTDVVHYFERAKRLLPDYMYEYNAAGQIKQMTTTEEGGGYFIWKYTYNDLRLRETEKCFSKERKLLGSVEYMYNR